MSSSKEHFVCCGQVLYLGKTGESRPKWKHRDVAVKGNARNMKYVVEVQRAQPKLISWKSKKPKIEELVPNSHAVIHMDSFDNHSNVIALVPINHSCHQIRGQFFTSQESQLVRNLKDIFSRCCDVISFDVGIEGGLTDTCNGKTQLHIFRERICIITNQGYDFRLLREWPIGSFKQVLKTQNGVKLIMTNETLALRTQQGNDIKSKLLERLCNLSPTSHGLPKGSFSTAQRDKNFNIAQHSRQQGRSCNSLLGSDVSSVSDENSLPLTKKSFIPNQRQLSSTHGESYFSDESVCRKDHSDAHSSSLGVLCFSDPCLVMNERENATPLDNELDTQRLLQLQSNKTVDHEYELNSSNRAQDDSKPVPPPIPLRQLKPDLTTNVDISEHTKEFVSDKSSMKRAVSCERVLNNSSHEECVIPRSRSFQIVEQPLCYKKRQRYKSCSSVARRTITEFVQPICVEPMVETTSSSTDEMDNLEPSNNSCLTGHEHCSPTDSQGEHREELPAAAEADDKIHHNDKIHYVNLPAGSRPSCYLYMNLPNLRNAPMEASTYINHVFMGRSMKGIYENVFRNHSSNSEEKETLPALPPPVLHPRKPPPRIPERQSRDRRLQHKPAMFPRTGPAPPPPRPPKKQRADIQVQGAVFASRAIASRVWYLRIVVMRHDQDDATFKIVKDREIASNYHLLQTFPFNISSDIIISLKHNCQQFKLISEDGQEVDYKIIENLVHGFWFVIEFHLQHLGSTADQFVGNVCMEPKNLLAGEKCPINKKFNLGITEEFELKKPWSHCEQFGRHFVGEKQASKCLISDYALRKNVCEKLDETIYSSNNWRDVAAQLGVFTAEEIKFIENKAHRCLDFSPMDYVLAVWEQSDPLCCIERLVSILQEIHRPDVVMDLGFPADFEDS